jgi:hypothetical protein
MAVHHSLECRRGSGRPRVLVRLLVSCGQSVTRGPVSIRGLLVVVGRALVGLGSSLCRDLERLVGIGERLIGVGGQLIRVSRDLIRVSSALYRSRNVLAPVIRGAPEPGSSIGSPIAWQNVAQGRAACARLYTSMVHRGQRSSPTLRAPMKDFRRRVRSAPSCWPGSSEPERRGATLQPW